MISKRIAASVGVLGMTALLVAGGSQVASANSVRTLNFTNVLDTLTPVDVAPAGPSAGDAFYVYSHVASGDVSGHTAASCVTVSVLDPGIKQCEVDFLTTRGTITTRGITNSVGAVVALVITGGTGSYAGTFGEGTLTPTPTGSTVTLRVRR
ncbi:MAG: hypothetical protein ACR2JG_04925 [Geodermatophilaceae bacterium]